MSRAQVTCAQCGRVKVAAYARISDDQKGERLGVTDQIEDCWRRAEAEGWCCCTPGADTYSDNDIGALRQKHRPGYEAMREAVGAGRYGVLVARDDSRLTRNVREAVALVELVEQSRTRVELLWTAHWDLSTAAGRKRVRDAFSDAQYEAERTGERVARARLRGAERGRPSPGGPRPWGFEKDKVAHHPAEADEIRDIARRLLAGESLRSASLRYDRSPKNVRRSLLTPRVAGKRGYHANATGGKRCTQTGDCPGCTFYPATWEPILDEATWLGVCALLRARDRDGVAGARPRKHLLAGLLFCGVCGSRCQIVRPGGRHKYACWPRGCVVRTARLIEEEVRDAVLAVADVAPPSEEVDPALVTAVQALQERIDDADQMFTDGVIPQGAYVKMRTQLVERFGEAQAALDAAAQAAPEAGYWAVEDEASPDELWIYWGDEADRRRWWDEADLRQRRVLLSKYVDRIVMHPNRVKRVHEPDSIEILWREGIEHRPAAGAEGPTWEAALEEPEN